jgi:hypothetical protein
MSGLTRSTGVGGAFPEYNKYLNESLSAGCVDAGIDDFAIRKIFLAAGSRERMGTVRAAPLAAIRRASPRRSLISKQTYP